MGIFNSFSKAAKTFIDDINTPESFKKGEKFESYTREVIFPSGKYKLLKQTHNYSQNSKDFVHESLEPDFEFECIETKKKFYIEAKFRSEIHDGKIKFSYKAQFDRYKEICKSEDVLIILGMGKDPSDPETVCLIPLKEIQTISLSESFIEKYKIPTNKHYPISKLQKFLESNKKSDAKSTPLALIKKDIVEKTVTKKSAGFCIRCQESLTFNEDKPLCKDCYATWSEYGNEEYRENFCHRCGKEKEVTFAKPICYSCYKQLYK